MSSVVVGIASTAPAYSLAASLGYVVITPNGNGILGTKAPLIMVFAFLPMYFIAVAYAELNKAIPDCGTTFTWAARAFGTRIGWMGGWGIIAADVIEIFTLVLFALFALAKVYFGGAPKTHIKPSLSWLSPSGLSLTSIVTATLIAVFIYWGWDTAVATNEEADDPATTPGRAAVLSTVLLLLIYAVVSIAAVSIAGIGDKGIGIGNLDNADDVFAGMGSVVFGGGVVGAVMVFFLKITVLTSASASTQTTILPTARTSLSMGAFKAIPTRFARIHPRYLTPTDSTIWMGAVSIVFYVGLTLVSQNILADTIAAVGLMIAFYYGLTGFACVWYYRKTMWAKPRDILMQGAIPLLGGVLLLFAFFHACHTYYSPDYGYTSLGSVGGVFIIGIGSLLFGLVLMFVYQSISPAYFRGATLPRAHHGELLLVPADGSVAHLGLPDSGEMPTVIAPDLSNLPPGQRAIDPLTGETRSRDDG